MRACWRAAAFTRGSGPGSRAASSPARRRSDWRRPLAALGLILALPEAAAAQPSAAPVAASASETALIGVVSPPLGSRREAAAAMFVLERVLDESGDAASVLRFYAPRLRYFDRGEISRREVMADKAAYFRRWPERRFRPDLATLETSVLTEEGEERAIDVRIEVEFDVAGPDREASGRSVVEVTLAPRGADAFIVVAEGGRVISRR